jgi:integrase
MAVELVDKRDKRKPNAVVVDDLPVPEKGNRRTPDSEVEGLNAQVTAAGRRSWVLRYRFHGVETLYTIGDYPDWNTAAARTEARRLKRMIDQGIDPKKVRDAERAAATVADLAKHYEAEYLPGKRPRSADEDRALIRDYIMPAIGKVKVADVTQADIRKLHREITAAGKPVRANRVLACLRTMFNLAMSPDWGKMRDDNPARGGTGGIRRNPEDGRERFLSPAEIARLSEALTRHSERTTVALIRFLMMTGCRFGEAANATWDQFDLAAGTWNKPSSHTKQKRRHTLPLSAPALALLSERRREATGSLVFPSMKPAKERSNGEHPITTIKTAWHTICRDAGLEGVRIHDLRHSFASVLAGAGVSLQLIGSLLGHAQVATTARYSHLADDARRAAVERVGAMITANGHPPADVVQMPKAGQRS